MNNYQIDFKKLKPLNYNRKSSEQEDRQMLSVTSQIDEANRIADFYKLQSFVEIFQESKSAKTEYKRPEFTRMMKMIRDGKGDSIVCWKLDRLARNMTEGGQIIDMLSSGVIKAIITNDKVFYPWDNVVVMAVEFSQGKQFLKDLSVNVKRGQTKKASMGVPHGVATLGFLNDKKEEKGNRKWIVDKDRFDTIKILFEMFLTGNYSAGKIYKYATDVLKLTTVKRKRSGGEPITYSRIYEILKDPIYAGFFFYGGQKYELDKSLPRMITEAQHEKVKMILSKRNIPKTQHHKTTYVGLVRSNEGDFMGPDVKYQVICDCKHKFAYRNKTECPKCGIDIDQMNNPKYLSYIHYYNVKKKKQGERYRYVNENSINEKMIQEISNNFSFSKELVDWSKKYIHEMKERELNENILICQRKEERKIELQEKKARIRAMLRDEKITEDEYREDVALLEKQYSDVGEEMEGIDWYSRLMEITDISLCIDSVLKSDDIEAKRKVIIALGSNLVWNDEKLLIINRKEVQAIIDAVKGIRSKYPEFEPKNYVINKGEKEKTPLENEVFSTMLLR